MILVQWRQEANILIKATHFVNDRWENGGSTFYFSIGQFLTTTDVCECDQLIDRVETVDEVVKHVNFRDNIALLKKGSQARRIRENEYPYLVRHRIWTCHCNEIIRRPTTSLKTLNKAVLGELCSVTHVNEEPYQHSISINQHSSECVFSLWSARHEGICTNSAFIADNSSYIVFMFSSRFWLFLTRLSFSMFNLVFF